MISFIKAEKKSLLLTELGYYFSYLLSFLVINIFITSLGAFFHFLLNHRLAIIENWVFENSWEILLWSKLLSMVFVIKLLVLRRHDEQSFIKFVKSLFKAPSQTPFVIIIFLLLFVLILHSPTASNQFASLYNELKSYFGSLIFYGTDFLLWAYLKYLFPPKTNEELISLLVIYPLCFYVGTWLGFPYAANLNFLIVFHVLTLLIFIYKGDREIEGVFYLVLLAAPLSSFLGEDPMWGSQYSHLSFKQPISLLTLFPGWLVVWGYLLRERLPLFFKTK